jgi:hypothetical protein
MKEWHTIYAYKHAVEKAAKEVGGWPTIDYFWLRRLHFSYTLITIHLENRYQKEFFRKYL